MGKGLEIMESRQILCIHRPQILTVSVNSGCKTLRECIRCLYNKVTDRLFVATSQSINDRREQIMRININQLARIRVPIVD